MPTRAELLPWFWAFFFTQAVEVPIYVALMRRAKSGPDEAPPHRLATQILLAFGASAITHPIVWFVIPEIAYRSYWTMAARAETFAVVAEGLYFYAARTFDFRRAMLWSLAANAASAGLGLLCRAAFGWP